MFLKYIIPVNRIVTLLIQQTKQTLGRVDIDHCMFKEWLLQQAVFGQLLPGLKCETCSFVLAILSHAYVMYI